MARNVEMTNFGLKMFIHGVIGLPLLFTRQKKPRLNAVFKSVVCALDYRCNSEAPLADDEPSKLVKEYELIASSAWAPMKATLASPVQLVPHDAPVPEMVKLLLRSWKFIEVALPVYSPLNIDTS